MTPKPASTRVVRGLLLAVTSAALSVAAHGAAGGSLSGFAPVLPLVLLVAGAATALADRHRGPLTILAALGVAQFAQHELLDLVHHHRAPAAGLGFDPVQMTTAHVLAALATGLLLAKADSALVSLVDAVSRLLPRTWAPGPVPGPRSTAIRAAGGPQLIELLLRIVNGRRGPPVVLVNRVP
ncbi:hypothetical protein ACFFQW_24110 [Umezawaea endophytica]|uniref:MFS transporter n=1 Tax=Umezawaea endophytica TaxID=1654476 RepID=A0A9X2VU16_9PSEU|nr:hypothetical protein [Umezawaea endophytica]MCS7482109.1 hypothetical protein [Umezawaea endophytica]